MVASLRMRWAWIAAAPVLFSPILYFGMPFRSVYCIVLISSFWIMEVAPTGIVSLLPIFLYPVLGISSAKSICLVYFKDSIVLFICTLIMTLAVEETNLHKRVALKLLCSVGTRKQTMLLGFMGTTAFLSFFVSDTACTALMIPIALAIIRTITRSTEASEDGRNDAATVESAAFKHLKKDERGFAKALVLACAHGSLIGGTAIITSTGPNLVFREIIQTNYAENEVSVSYVQWMAFAMPPMLLYLASSFIVLTCCFMGPRQLCTWFTPQTKEEQRISVAVEKRIRTAYDELGAITFGEKSVCAWFLILMACWIMRKPGFIPGWGELFPDHGKLLSDTVPAILVAFLLFAWPRDPWAKEPVPILNWNAMKAKFSWSCILLIGAGYAISEGVQKSGLSILIACLMKDVFGKLDHVYLLFAVTASITFMTEFASNVSTGSVFIPIVLTIAESIHIHPLTLSLPVTVACSFAFMLPMATPPNAIVFDTKLVGMLEMLLSGILLNICCILITVLNLSTWTHWLFDLGTFPQLTQHYNGTLDC
ncbi:unnamed protein product [Cylicocyclus nassatus]|uniref:Solute carrier family 13 member 5 n=1 Tax=Cylicocyclus nassatus TaxID=53992 RepID=A0AA36M5W2_CYLNA|nr:unnamed protein product [Cylicocyclus nassatus]